MSNCATVNVPSAIANVLKNLISTEDRRIWSLAWPIILSNLSVPLVGMADAAVVGRLGDAAYIGAIALGAMLFSILYWSFGFLRMGTTGFVAQAVGRRDGSRMRDIMSQSTLVAAVIGVGIILVQWPILKAALALLDGSDRVEALTSEYFLIRIYSAPAVLVMYVSMGVLIGLSNTKAILGVQLFLNIGNVLLDILFVMVLGYDVDGVAWASLIAETSAAWVAAYLAIRSLSARNGAWDHRRILDWHDLKQLFRSNGNLFIRTVGVIAGFSLFTVLGTRMGDTVLAANFILMNMLHILSYGLDGFAHAAEVLTGEAYGQRAKNSFRTVVYSSTRLALITAVGFTLFWWLAGSAFIHFMTNLVDVRRIALHHLPWIVAAPLIAVWSYQLDGIFIGTTHTRQMRDGMLISLIALVIACAILIPIFSNHGLWAAMMVFFAARALTLYRWLPVIEASFNAHAAYSGSDTTGSDAKR